MWLAWCSGEIILSGAWMLAKSGRSQEKENEARGIRGNRARYCRALSSDGGNCSLLPSASAQEAITKCHGWGGFNNKPLSLPVLEAAESKVEAPADSMSVESSLLGSQTTVFSRGLSMSEGAGRPLGALP